MRSFRSAKKPRLPVSDSIGLASLVYERLMPGGPYLFLARLAALGRLAARLLGPTALLGTTT